MNATNCSTNLVSLAMTSGTSEYLSLQAFLLTLTLAALPLNWFEGYLESRTMTREHLKSLQKLQRWMIYLYCLCFIKLEGSHFLRHLFYSGCNLLVQAGSCKAATYLMSFASYYLHLSHLAIVVSLYPNNFISLWRNFECNLHFTVSYIVMFATLLTLRTFSTPETLLPTCAAFETEMSRHRTLMVSLYINIFTMVVFFALHFWQCWRLRDPVIHLQMTLHYSHSRMKEQMDMFFPNLFVFCGLLISHQVFTRKVMGEKGDFLERLHFVIFIPVYFCFSPIVSAIEYAFLNRRQGLRPLFLDMFAPQTSNSV